MHINIRRIIYNVMFILLLTLFLGKVVKYFIVFGMLYLAYKLYMILTKWSKQ